MSFVHCKGAVVSGVTFKSLLLQMGNARNIFITNLRQIQHELAFINLELKTLNAECFICLLTQPYCLLELSNNFTLHRYSGITQCVCLYLKCNSLQTSPLFWETAVEVFFPTSEIEEILHCKSISGLWFS